MIYPTIYKWLSVTDWLTGWLTEWLGKHRTTEPMVIIFGMGTTFWSVKWLQIFFSEISNNVDRAHKFLYLCDDFLQPVKLRYTWRKIRRATTVTSQQLRLDCIYFIVFSSLFFDCSVSKLHIYSLIFLNMKKIMYIK